MDLFSSVSSALDHIHLPTNANFGLNFGVGYFGSVLRGHSISAAIITVTAALAASYHVLFNILEINKPKGYRDIPQLNSWSIIYNTVIKEMPFHRRYDKVIRQTLEEHGISRMNLLGRSIVYLGAPEYARQLLQHTETFQKILPTEQFPDSLASRLLGNNILFSNSSSWKHHRKVCNPAFHKSWSTDVFGNCTNPMLQLIASETKNGAESINMSDMLKRLTLDALGSAAFGFEFKAVEDPNGKYVALYHYIMANTFNPFYIIIPWLDSVFRRKKLYKAVDDFDRLIFNIIDEKRQKLRDAKEQGVELDDKDLLSMMIEANESDKDALTNDELRSNAVIFFIAGHDTTANALTCAIYHLSRHPDLQEKLHAEIFNIIGPAITSDSTPIPTLEQTKEMKFLDAVIKEVMRLHPSVNMLPPRRVSSNTQVGPYIIPPGAEVQLSIYSIHHNPKYWDSPEEFRPERFLPANGNIEKRDPTMWMPFSYGSRSCLGTNFSLIEQRVVLSMLIHKFKFALPANSPHKDFIQFTARSSLAATDNVGIEFTPRY